ncbi:hypothetical protein M407DRAFT_244487 [Tulasnella calospora MUT 4182]|uniref:Uncharacterized protein n=1 Tax=Tulasnella calospora MUT 4182 TaxID=1051891 RepID=A0A0C3KS76_9AGAM|nr:hypothetical protein M407DRAFT_244487 [Tulasnella calospora MUT 4182]
MSLSAQESRPSTRQRKSNLKSDPASENLPPKRQGKATRQDVQPPFWNTPYRKFINYLTVAALLIALFYTWRITQWKAQAGGWVNLLLGRHPNEPLPDPTKAAEAVGGAAKEYVAGSNGNQNTVLEDRLRDLAYDLGIHPKDLASAIRPLIPTASISSIAQANPTEPGMAVSVLADGDVSQETGGATDKVKLGLAAVMGLDEPVDFDD